MNSRRNSLGSIPHYINQAHASVNYSALADADELRDNHTPEKGLEIAGDPLSNDIIFTFANNARHGHWYCLILDKRPEAMTVTVYESLSVSNQAVKEKCSFLIKFVHALSLHGRTIIVRFIGHTLF